MIKKTYFKTKDYCKVKFSLEAENAETIEILGLNSDWENGVILTKKKDGTFTNEINLPLASTHEFKYRINGESWSNEPEADSEVENAFGGLNSVLAI